MTNLTILIPAAGASSRMRGGDKLLELVGADPMLRRQALIALAVCANVIITLRTHDPVRRATLTDLDITVVPVAEASEGMAASIRAGALAAGNTALMILPADMPDLTSTDLQSMIDAFDQTPSRIIRATAQDGTPGHPVLFPADLIAELAVIKGDEGARSVLQAHKHRLRLIALPDQHAITDLDTPENWAAWRSLRQ